MPVVCMPIEAAKSAAPMCSDCSRGEPPDTGGEWALGGARGARFGKIAPRVCVGIALLVYKGPNNREQKQPRPRRIDLRGRGTIR